MVLLSFVCFFFLFVFCFFFCFFFFFFFFFSSLSFLSARCARQKCGCIDQSIARGAPGSALRACLSGYAYTS